MSAAYQPDRSIVGKIRRRLVRLLDRRPAPRGAEQPLVSFAFDDPPASAALAGARALEARGARGTYFLSAGLVGGTGPMGPYAVWGDIGRVAAAGHEIACHTFSHLDCGQASGEQAVADVERNRKAFLAHGLPAPTTFAYPYGDVSPAAKAALAPRYALLRALHHGLIEAGCDLNQTPAVGVEGPDGEAVAMAWLNRALERKAWLILYTHDVVDQPSVWGCQAAVLERLIAAALEGGAEIVTVAEGARRSA